MTDKDRVVKMLEKAGIEFEEKEDSISSIITDSDVEFVFKKNGSLKKISAKESETEEVDVRKSWQYFDNDDLEDDDL
jgi:hypothetical protein